MNPLIARIQRRVHSGASRIRRLMAKSRHQMMGSPQQNVPVPHDVAKIAEVQHPFYNYHSRFNAVEIIKRHAHPNLQPHPEYITNFMGLRVNPDYCPFELKDTRGIVEGLPVPNNWHACTAEWAASLRAVELSRKTFTVVELGCGWGCWLNNTGLAAKRLGRKVKLIGIEGDKGHMKFAREATQLNGFQTDELDLIHGIAAGSTGTALFPIQKQSGHNWGLEPVFGCAPEEMEAATQSGRYEALPMVSLPDVVKEQEFVDLLHVDIQGGEADLIEDCLSRIQDRVRYIVIGTHSREIEGRLFEAFLKAGWVLEMERPAILNVLSGMPRLAIDGVQGWFNPHAYAKSLNVIWGDGFYSRESDGVHDWRWCQSQGILQIHNTSSETKVAHLDFCCVTGQEKVNPLRIASPLFSAELQVNCHGTTFSASVSVPPGRHEVSFATTAESMDVPNELRTLVFHLKDFNVTAES